MNQYLSYLLSFVCLCGLVASRFPPGAGVIDVAAYGAVPGDGLDDWAAFQAAERDAAGVGKPMVIGCGVWNLSQPVVSKNAAGKWVANWLVFGEGSDCVVVEAPAGAFVFGSTVGNVPSSTPSGGGVEAFRNTLEGMRIRSGAGATAVDWMCNNRGALRDLVVEDTGGGAIGISQLRAYPGPCLIERVRVTGFDRGIYVGQVSYQTTYRDLELWGQRVFGLDASASSTVIDGLVSDQTGTGVPAIRMESASGQLTLRHASMIGGVAGKSAIQVGAISHAWTSDVSFSGYGSLFKGNPVLDTTPAVPLSEWSPPSYVPAVAGDPSVLVLSQTATYSDTTSVPCSVRLIEGMEATLRAPAGVWPAGHPWLRLDSGCRWDQPLTIRHLWGMINLGGGDWIEHRDGRPVFLEDVQLNFGNPLIHSYPGSGPVFLSDVVLQAATFEGTTVQAQQLNPESSVENPGIICDECSFNVLGIKTEGMSAGGKPTITFKNHAKANLFGGFFMPCVNRGSVSPELGFVVENSDVFFHYVNWCGKAQNLSWWNVQILEDGTPISPVGFPSYAVQGGNKLFVSHRSYSDNACLSQ